MNNKPYCKGRHAVQQKKESIKMFLIEKRDGTNKAQGCADGRSQRKYTTKAEMISP